MSAPVPPRRHAGRSSTKADASVGRTTGAMARGSRRGSWAALSPLRYATVAAFACTALLGPAAAAGADLDTPPLAGPPRPLAIAAPTEFRLANGLRVVLAERRGVQLVTAALLVLAGSEADPPSEAGLASVTAGLLTRGTRHRDATRLAQDAESLGGLLDSHAGWHTSEVGITVMVPKLDAALALVSEVVREPAFAPAELDRLRAQTLDELKVGYSRPDTLARLASQRLLFGSGAYGHPASGTPASLPRIGRPDLIALHAARYRPENAVLVLAGDLDPDAAARLAERHFGAWQVAAPAAPPVAPRPNAESAAPMLLVDLPHAGQAAVVVAAPLPPLAGDRATAAILNAVLGGGFSARLNQEIRIRRGLSYGAASALDPRPLGASLRATVQTKNESAAEVVALVQAELDRLAAEPIDAAELATRKTAVIGDFSRSVETTSGLAAAVEALIAAGLPTSDLRTRIAALAAVDPAELRRYAAANLAPERRRVAVAGDTALFAPALRQRVPGLRVIPAERLVMDPGALDVSAAAVGASPPEPSGPR